MQAFLAILLVTGGSASETRPIAHECSAQMGDVEYAATTRRITTGDWQAFRRVAQLRLKSGKDALPEMIGCPDLDHSGAELRADAATRSSLRRAGISAGDYMQIGWALLVADDPESFGVRSTPAVVANITFVGQHRFEVDSLLAGR